MGFTQRVISVFLASPGDLEEERKAVRQAVESFNKLLSSMLGYRIELVGWEETIAGTGRPQHLINKELERCDLFLGMMNRRWGTPPDNDGKFTSGFEEEFKLSVKRNEKTKSPEIALFFKKVPSELQEDPGPDLKKVLDFRDSIVSEKKFLFNEFQDSRDMANLAYQCIVEFIKRIQEHSEEEETENLADTNAVRSKAEAETDDVNSEVNKLSPLSGEGYNFLENFVGKMRAPDSLDSISSAEVARFRLLANTVAKPGNDTINLGTHDINILFRAFTDNEVFGEKELISLVRLGFQGFEFKNTPIWCWYSELKKCKRSEKYEPALVYSLVGKTASEKAGAIEILKALEIDISSSDEELSRNDILKSWLADDSAADVKISALRYLYAHGTLEDLPHIEHIVELNEHRTSQKAFETSLKINLRFGQIASVSTKFIESQVDNLEPSLLDPLLEHIKHLDVATLRLGLDHKHYQVRLTCIRTLYDKQEIDIRMAEKLCEDKNIFIRNEAVQLLERLGKKLSEDEVKNILSTERKSLRSSVSTWNKSEEENIFENYRIKALKRLSISELEEKISKTNLFDHTPYFSMIDKFISSKIDELRRNIDDRFSSYFDDVIERMLSPFDDKETRHALSEKAHAIKNFESKNLVRRGLTILSKYKKPQDIIRLRSVLNDKTMPISVYDLEMFKSYGGWNDIPLLANANCSNGTDSMLLSTPSNELEDLVARTIAVLSKTHSISDLLSIEMPANILSRVIHSCSIANFKRIRSNTLHNLLSHKSDNVRQITALKAVMSFNKKDITVLLDDYLNREGFRYYNVSHWLDLGISMTKAESKRIASDAMDALL